MKKRIWIMNHYATNTYFDKGGRHYWFAENLIKKGYEPTIFCANTKHNSKDIIDTGTEKFIVSKEDKIPFVFVKTSKYSGNGLSRIKNMVNFALNLFLVSKKYAERYGKPDIILASSVHPLTLVAGIKIAKKFGVPCICEVRDLWPESIVEFSNLKRDSIVAKILYQGEKLIYKKAGKLIFTMEGGRDYIVDKGWDLDNGNCIDIEKVHHINNGVDLAIYDKNIRENPYEDGDLNNLEVFKVVYAGSIRKANNLNLLINAAKYVQKESKKQIKIFIFGDGDEKKELQKKCMNERIDNVVFKGKVDKQYIPSILSKSDLNVLNYSNHEIWKYGGSQNKNFEYLASGKPVLSTISMGYDIIEKYNAGISLKDQTAESIGEAIISIAKMETSKYEKLSENARRAAKDYDFCVLTDKLINVIEKA